MVSLLGSTRPQLFPVIGGHYIANIKSHGLEELVSSPIARLDGPTEWPTLASWSGALPIQSKEPEQNEDSLTTHWLSLSDRSNGTTR